MAKVIGIDLGTTNSAMAVMEAGEPAVLENTEGGRTTPSVVAVNPKTGERYVGMVAKRQAVTNPENTVYSVKRLIGRKFTEVQSEMKTLGYDVKPGKAGDAAVRMGDRDYAPPEIAAMVLQKLKADAEAKLGETVTQAVITVPAYFNDSQRQATKDAGQVAGLEVLRIINEPTAASLAYGLDKGQEAVIAVYDLGGGTFDISILHIGDGVFEVKSTNGDTHLGGDDFDQRIIDWVADEFRRDQGIDLRQDKMALQRLKEAAERAKVELSTVMQTEINLPFVTADASGPKHLTMTLSRARLDQITADPRNADCRSVPAGAEGRRHRPGRCCRGRPCRRHDADAGCGGESQGAVRKGSRTRASTPTRSWPSAPRSKRVSSKARSRTSCSSTSRPFRWASRLSGPSQRRSSSATRPFPRLTPRCSRPRPIRRPAWRSTCSRENEAWRARTSPSARFTLDGLAPAPRGVPQIDVTFDIDANGILSVSAKDKATNKEQRITITASSGLSSNEVERLVREAEAHAEEDAKRRELVEVRNHADSAAYQADKALHEHGDRITEELKTEVQGRISDVRALLTSEDSAAIRSAVDELTASVAKIGEQVYASQQQDVPAGR